MHPAAGMSSNVKLVDAWPWCKDREHVIQLELKSKSWKATSFHKPLRVSASLLFSYETGLQH